MICTTIEFPIERRFPCVRSKFLCAMSGLCMAFVSPIPGSAQTVMTKQQVNEAVPRIEVYIDEAMAEWGTPGVAIGIVAEDELVYAGGFGSRGLGDPSPVDADTVFQIGSTTKAFLGVTLAQLVEDGLLRWNDRVIDHDPQFRMADPWVTREFRIGDLLAQRSGLPFSALTNMMLYGYPRDEVIRALQYIEPVTSFRSEFAYQNAFHLVAGRIIAHTSGASSWEQFLQERLLDPLGMDSTSYTAEAIEEVANHAAGHRFDTNETVVDPFGLFPYIAGGAGNLNSNVRDMSRWVRFHINGGEIDGRRILDREALAALYEPRILISGPIGESARIGKKDMISYATGWMIHSTPLGRIIEHAGGTVGFASHIVFDPERRFGVIVLVNQSVEVGNSLAIPFGKYVLDLLHGREPEDYASATLEAMKKTVAAINESMLVPVDARDLSRPLDAFLGDYESPVLGLVSIQRDAEGRLAFVLGPEHIPVTLTHWSGDTFVARIPVPVRKGEGRVERIKLQFTENASGEISFFKWLGEGDASGQPPFIRRMVE